jgi:hypothetical protein
MNASGVGMQVRKVEETYSRKAFEGSQYSGRVGSKNPGASRANHEDMLWEWYG